MFVYIVYFWGNKTYQYHYIYLYIYRIIIFILIFIVIHFNRTLTKKSRRTSFMQQSLDFTYGKRQTIL